MSWCFIIKVILTICLVTLRTLAFLRNYDPCVRVVSIQCYSKASENGFIKVKASTKQVWFDLLFCDCLPGVMICMLQIYSHALLESFWNADRVHRTSISWHCVGVWNSSCLGFISLFKLDSVFLCCAPPGCSRADQRRAERFSQKTACWRTSTLMRCSWERNR